MGELHEIIILEIAKELEKEIQEVTKALKEIKPDVIAIGLSSTCIKSLTNRDENEEIKIHELLSRSKLYFLLMQILLACSRKKTGEEIGVRSNKEMRAVVEIAQNAGARISFVAMDEDLAFQFFWNTTSLLDKVRFMGSIISAALEHRKDEPHIDNETQQDVVLQMIHELRKSSTVAANALEDEYDAYIASKLFHLSKEGKVLAIVSKGHKEGIKRRLTHPEGIIAIREMNKRPTKKITLSNVLGAAMTTLILIIMGLMLVNIQSNRNLLLAFGIWFTVTGSLSALGVILARGHLFSAFAALMVAWLTTLIPFIAAGLFAGAVEAWMLKPTLTDFKMLSHSTSIGQVMNNRLFKVILVAILANLGSIIGMFLGIYIIWQRLELVNPAEFIKDLL